MLSLYGKIRLIGNFRVTPFTPISGNHHMREEHDLLIAPTSVRNADESLAKLSEEMTQNKQKREEQDWMVWGPPKSLVDFMENPTKIWLEKMENASMKSING